MSTHRSTPTSQIKAQRHSRPNMIDQHQVNLIKQQLLARYKEETKAHSNNTKPHERKHSPDKKRVRATEDTHHDTPDAKRVRTAEDSPAHHDKVKAKVVRDTKTLAAAGAKEERARLALRAKEERQREKDDVKTKKDLEKRALVKAKLKVQIDKASEHLKDLHDQLTEGLL